MTEQQRLKHAITLLSESKSAYLKSVADSLDALAKGDVLSATYNTKDQKLICLDFALQWCKVNGFDLDYLRCKARFPPKRVYGQHMLRRHLWRLGFKQGEIGRVVDRDRTTIIYSLALDQRNIDQLLDFHNQSCTSQINQQNL